MVAAAAMIAGALFVRSALDDRKEEKGRVYSLVCSEDLAPACDEVRDAYPGRVDVTVEPAGVTADRLVRADDDPGLDGWLVTAPWREIVDGARRSRGKVPIFGDAPPPRSPARRSPSSPGRSEPTRSAPRCTPLTWKCLGEAAGTPGGWAGGRRSARMGSGEARPRRRLDRRTGAPGAGPGRRRVLRAHRPVDHRPRRRRLPALAGGPGAGRAALAAVASLPHAPAGPRRLRRRRDDQGRGQSGRAGCPPRRG